MSKHLERDLEQLEKELLALSAEVEEMIGKACCALRERRSDLAEAVIESDVEVDRREVQIEGEALKITALHQPVAIDLRRVATVIKINNDLERIADLAVNIAEGADELVVYPDFVIPAELDEMAERAIAMVRGAIDAFVQLNVELAERICASDDEIDALNAEVTTRLCEFIQSNPDKVLPALHCFSASRHLERIADHATNIAEDVIFLVKGEIARHKPETPFFG